MTPIIHPELHLAMHRARVAERERLASPERRPGAPKRAPHLRTRLVRALAAAVAAGRVAFADPAPVRPGGPR